MNYQRGILWIGNKLLCKKNVVYNGYEFFKNVIVGIYARIVLHDIHNIMFVPCLKDKGLTVFPDTILSL